MTNVSRRHLSPAALRLPRRQGVEGYLAAEEATRTGDHAIPADIVAGRPHPPRRTVAISRSSAAAESLVNDLLSVLGSAARDLRDRRVANGKLDNDDLAALAKIAGASAPLLREHRRLVEADRAVLSSMTDEELAALLPPEVAEALRLTSSAEPETQDDLDTDDDPDPEDEEEDE